MAMKFSQEACERMAGSVKATITAATIALVDGGASDDTITDSGSGFVAAGFEVGDLIEVTGATDADDEVFGIPLIAVATGTLTVPTGTWTTGEAAGASITVKSRYPGSLADLFTGGDCYVYTGTRPSTPNADPGSVITLLTISDLRFGDAAWDSTDLEAYISKLTGESLSATASGNGTPGWFRLVMSGHSATGASTTAVRADGQMGTTGEGTWNGGDVESGLEYSLSNIKLTVPYTTT